jgi:uncharacterized Fe-S cluster-containing radical SAM superfamily protein
VGYDPVARHRDIESLVIQEQAGGDRRKYNRFRSDSAYGGIITADCAGCGLTCKFCWERKDSTLEGRDAGEFLGPGETAERLLGLMKEHKVRQARISGGEPAIGRSHLFPLLNVFQHKRVRFILETNGISIGADESYAQELALYPFVHVRVSLKGCTEEEFARLTGADPRGFHLQLNALRNLKKAGVSAHPAVMISFSEREAADRLYGLIWKIDPIMHSEIEEEQVILYPHVAEKLRKAGLQARSAHVPEKKKEERGPKSGKRKDETPRIREAHRPAAEETRPDEPVPRIRPKNARVIRIR